MSIKVNFVLDEDVKSELDSLVRKGGRSRVINDALRKELARIRRERALDEMIRLRGKTTPTSSSEIVDLLGRDRGRR
jgi:Arc/MetJ-type ribon-helix-helix transcriptional regulator